MTTTVTLDHGKYEFDLDERGLIVAARRHGEPWPAGFDMRFQGAFVAALWRVEALQRELAEAQKLSIEAKSPRARCDFTLKLGDLVYHPAWGEGRAALEIVDLNWAFRVAAVRLSPTGGVIVWSVANLRRDPY